MKVYATELKNNGELVLITWPSAKAFNKTESWIDPRFVQVVTTAEVIGLYSYPHYEGMVIRGEAHIASHKMLHEKYLEMTA